MLGCENLTSRSAEGQVVYSSSIPQELQSPLQLAGLTRNMHTMIRSGDEKILMELVQLSSVSSA